MAWSTATAADFTRTLSSEEIQQAGLAKLSPEELGRLETLIERYKAGTVAPAATPAAAAQTAAAVPAVKPSKILPSWVGALVTLERASAQADKADAMESRLAGNFSGWQGRTSFRLENGQVWIQTNGESYDYSPSLASPKVKIYPASLGSYWLEIEGVNQRCRVRPVKLQ